MTELNDDEFKLFQQLLISESGLYFGEERRLTLYDALFKRITELKYSSFIEYFSFLKYNPEREEELNSLLDLLTVGETYFYRNPAQFEALIYSVLPEIIRPKTNPSTSLGARDQRPKTISIWSAGCSSGEEPYTLAMVLKENLPDIENWNVCLYATDVNREFLKKAAEGIYNERSIKYLPASYLNKYFTRQGNQYVISDEIKKMVSFSYYNLAKDPPAAFMSGLDIIFCRNVTIYFNYETAKKVIEKFYDLLKDEGYLFLGHSETLWQMTDKFQAVEFPQTFIYKKELNPNRIEEITPFVDLPTIEIEDMPAVQPEDLFSSAYDLANEGKYEEAVEKLKKIISYDNLIVEAYYLMGVLYQKVGNLEEAEREFRRAIYVNPDLSIAYYDLGNIYLFQEKYSKARLEYQNAVRILQKKPPDALVDFSKNLTCELLLIVCGRMLEKIIV